MNKKIFIAVSLLIHGLLLFAGGIVIEKTIPLMMVRESGFDSGKVDEKNTRELMAFLQTNRVEMSKENGSPVVTESMHQLGEHTYVVRYNFVVIVLILLSLVFHISLLRKLKVQPVGMRRRSE